MDGWDILLMAANRLLDAWDDMDDECEVNGYSTFDKNHWYMLIHRAVDAAERQKYGLPPAPVTGRPLDSKDSYKRRPRGYRLMGDDHK